MPETTITTTETQNPFDSTETLRTALGLDQPEAELVPTVDPNDEQATVDTRYDAAALEGITPEAEATPVVEQEPKLSELTQQTVQQLYDVAQSYGNFTNAFMNGQFDAVEQMFEQFNPEAYKAFLAHVYAKNIENWTDRWIEEKEGKYNPRANAEIAGLRGEVQQLRATMQQQLDQQQNDLTQRQQRELSTRFERHVHSLFDTIKFAEPDRKWVSAEIMRRVAADVEAMNGVRVGKFGAVTKIFKDAVSDYVGRDKVKSAAAAEVQASIDNRKPLTSTSGGVQLQGALPEDIKQVPKGREEEWFDQQLLALKKKYKR